VVFDVVEHPWFQRLRRIQQLGLGSYVYPGAIHTRFQHALGAVHLMGRALQVLRAKGHEITDGEAESAMLAILLHDMGHGPYSHALERTLVAKVHHEQLSLRFMQELNGRLDGKLSLAIAIFTGAHPKRFLHQLVSSQLDVDRLDYLTRDSYFTGVSEGVIGYNRIIDMMDVHEGELVIEAKGIYSIEKFIVARRIMYWQVYLHKTVLCAEEMLIRTLERAIYLAGAGEDLFATPPLAWFLDGRYQSEPMGSAYFLEQFARLDDTDVLSSLKVWQDHPDPVLSLFASGIVNRRLFRINLRNAPFSEEEIDAVRTRIKAKFQLDEESVDWLFLHDKTSNSAYKIDVDRIRIKYRDGNVRDVAEASDQGNIMVLSNPVVKSYLCYPKAVG
jgi:HD superfamily phosphohydrolase